MKKKNKNDIVYGTIIDVSGSTATVKLLSGGILRNLKYYGGIPTVGNNVIVYWDGVNPYIMIQPESVVVSAPIPSSSPSGGNPQPGSDIEVSVPVPLTLVGVDDVVQFTVRGNSTQTHNIIEIQNSATTTVLSINKYGVIGISPTSSNAPFVLGSNAQGQLVSGLNSDLWDGYEFSDYLNQGVKSSSSPTFTYLNISPSSSHAPFVLNANAQDQLVIGLNADQWDGYEFADYLNQGVRTSDSPTHVGLTLSGLNTGVVQSNASGILSYNLGTEKYITKWGTDGITDSIIYENGGDVGIGITTGFNSKVNILDTASQLTLYYDASNSVDFFMQSGGALKISPSDHQIDVDASLVPCVVDTYDLGSSSRLWRKGYLSELQALLFAEQTIQVLGGWMMIAMDEGTLPSDVSLSDTQIDFGKSMTENDFIIFRGLDTSGSPQVEYMKIGTLVGGTTYNVTRDVDGSGANNWPAGMVFVVLGNTGDHRIELVANQGNGARISMYEQGSSYNSQTERLRIGNIAGDWGIGGSVSYGVAFGDYSNVAITIEDSNGLRIMNNGTVVGKWDTAGEVTIGDTAEAYITLNTNGIYLYNNDGAEIVKIGSDGKTRFGGYASGVGNVLIDSDGSFYVRNYTTKKFVVEPDGDLKIGTNITSPSTTGLAIFSAAQTYNYESVGVGDILIGDNSDNKANMLWSEGKLNFRGGTTTQLYIDTDGTLVAGDESVKIGSNGINIYTGYAHDYTCGEKLQSESSPDNSEKLMFYKDDGITNLSEIFSYYDTDCNKPVTVIRNKYESGGAILIQTNDDDAGDISISSILVQSEAEKSYILLRAYDDIDTLHNGAEFEIYNNNTYSSYIRASIYNNTDYKITYLDIKNKIMRRCDNTSQKNLVPVLTKALLKFFGEL